MDAMRWSSKPRQLQLQVLEFNPNGFFICAFLKKISLPRNSSENRTYINAPWHDDTPTTTSSPSFLTLTPLTTIQVHVSSHTTASRRNDTSRNTTTSEKSLGENSSSPIYQDKSKSGQVSRRNPFSSSVPKRHHTCLRKPTSSKYITITLQAGNKGEYITLHLVIKLPIMSSVRLHCCRIFHPLHLRCPQASITHIFPSI